MQKRRVGIYNFVYICIIFHYPHIINILYNTKVFGNLNQICLLAISIYILQNGDGFISAKELGVLMRAMGRNPTEDEIMQIMNEIDVDHNGNFSS